MREKIIFTNGLIDLAQPRLGTKVIYKTDDFLVSGYRTKNKNIFNHYLKFFQHHLI